MATLHRLLKEVDSIVKEIYDQQLEAEVHRKEEYDAAVRIQSWYRGIRTRSQVKHLHQSALRIQRHYRGFIGRQRIRNILIESVKKMCLSHYNRQAAQIQKMWRGFYVRKYVFDYYSRKKYLESLMAKNEMIRSELAEHAESMLREQRKREDDETRRRLHEWAERHHYLVSTVVQPSVFNSPYRPFTLPEETLLLNTRPKTPPKAASLGHGFDPSWRQYGQAKLVRLPSKLPPLPAKPQGPFRQPEEVRAQRYREFQPSLRVATDYESVKRAREQWRAEEWTGRLHDEVFKPTKGLREKAYQPLMHTASEYGHLPYGTVHFREVQPERHVTQDRFRTIVPPVPVFDKLNGEYVEGYVEN